MVVNPRKMRNGPAVPYSLIERLPGTNRYQLTPLGRRVAVLFTKAHGRVLAPGLAWLDPHLPADISQRSPLAKAWRQLDHAIEDFIADRQHDRRLKLDLTVNFVTSKSN